MAITTSTHNEQTVLDYLAWCQSTSRKSATTVLKYSYTLRRFSEWCGSKPFAAMTTQELERFVCDRPRTMTTALTTTTIKREMSELRTFYKWMLRERRCGQNPAADLIVPQPNEADPHPVDEHKWQQLWFSGILRDSDRVALGLAYFSGLRRHEVTMLQPHQVKADVLVDVKRKGGRLATIRYRSNAMFWGKRRPDLTGDIEEMFLAPLARVTEERRGCDWLLPWRDDRDWRRIQYQVVPDDGTINPNLFNRRINHLLRNLGMQEGDVRPHALRHGFCTNLIREGVDLPTVARLAGHTSVSVTMRYIKTSEDPLGELLD